MKNANVLLNDIVLLATRPNPRARWKVQKFVVTATGKANEYGHPLNFAVKSIRRNGKIKSNDPEMEMSPFEWGETRRVAILPPKPPFPSPSKKVLVIRRPCNSETHSYQLLYLPNFGKIHRVVHERSYQAVSITETSQKNVFQGHLGKEELLESHTEFWADNRRLHIKLPEFLS